MAFTVTFTWARKTFIYRDVIVEEGGSGQTCLRCCSSYRYAAVSNTTLLFPILPCEIIFTGFR